MHRFTEKFMSGKRQPKCREAITALQAERDEINGKIFDPDQEPTNFQQK